MAGTVEDTRDTIGFGQQSGVRDSKAETDTETLHSADDGTRLGEYD